MATMVEQDRAGCWSEFMREDGVSITKADLRAAVNALDDWFDANASTTLNNALPVAARNGLTTTQKARLLRAVIARRYLAGV
jgi:hypothetical protein